MSATMPPAPAYGRAPVLALFGAVLLALVWLLRDTGAAMVEIWWRSETFTHAFLVPPITLWLIWRRRAAWAGLPARPMPQVLLPMAALCVLWLVAELAAVGAASQFALVGLIVLSVPALLGPAYARAWLFPLAFLFFAVPVGEFLVPTLIDHTADFTVAALRATGIPVYREGNEFVIPSGHWSVVEACSGVRYLIASLMVGTLYAYLNYQSMKRRLAFVGVAILVPIVANWLRAYMIVMIGHLSSNKLAVGVDHLIYGWIFFGVVIALMFFIGARWAEPEPDPTRMSFDAQATAAPASPARMGAVAAALLLLVGGTQAWLWQLDRDVAGAAAPQLSLPTPSQGGAGAVAATDFGWTPGWQNPSVQASDMFVVPGGDARPVMLWVGYYRGQGPERKLVSSINRWMSDDKRWAVDREARRSIASSGEPLDVVAADLREAVSLTGAAPRRLRAWRVYWIDGHFVASDAEAKLRQAWARLAGRGDDGAVLVWATPAGDGADARLETFIHAMRADLAARMVAVRDAR